MKKLLLVLPLFLVSCCTPDVSAERATFDAIEPEYRDYVEGDEQLTEEQKLRRFRMLDTWRMRLESQAKPEEK